ncbi:MAG: hypothetical protein JWP48_5047 [Actinoallomurus sp.]|jgi:hypothetical protein|nr:hypothetical protein [Actinoallomurus sp.]
MSSGAADSRTDPRVDALRVAHSSNTPVDASGSVAIWKGMSKPQAVSARHVVVPELVSFVAEIK